MGRSDTFGLAKACLDFYSNPPMFIQMLTGRTSSVGRSDTFGLAVCALGSASCHCNFSFNDLHYFFLNILLLINICMY